jgi:hypothetical protein
MKTRAIILTGLTSLLLGVSLPPAFGQAPAAGRPDAQGNIGAPETAAPAAVPALAPAHACLQLHNGVAIFNFDVIFDPNVTNFPITGGTITGNICNAPQWKVTGGKLGPNLTITATRPAGGSCATQLTVAGNFANPSSYTGTYGFPGAGFQQHTLFLGYQKTSCP